MFTYQFMQAPKLEEIVKIIKEKRKALGLSREKIAELLGITPGAYASIENGTNEIRASYLIKLVEYLEIENIFVDQSKEASSHPSIKTARDLAQLLKGDVENMKDLLEEILKK